MLLLQRKEHHEKNQWVQTIAMNFSFEYPKFHCTNPIWNEKEKQQIQRSSKLNLNNSINTIFWYVSYVDKKNKWIPKFPHFDLNLVYESVFGFLTFNLVYDLVYIWYIHGIQRMTKKNDCD